MSRVREDDVIRRKVFFTATKVVREGTIVRHRRDIGVVIGLWEYKQECWSNRREIHWVMVRWLRRPSGSPDLVPFSTVEVADVVSALGALED